MANTFELIASYTASGSVAAINFTSIPSTYTDLVVTGSLRCDANQTGGTALCYQFNSSTSGYSAKFLYGDGSAAGSFSGTTLSANGSTYGRLAGTGIANTAQTSNTFSSMYFYIPNYAGSNNKSGSFDAVVENNGTAAESNLSASLWSNTSAITSISFAPYNGANFVQYTTMYLYGVKNA